MEGFKVMKVWIKEPNDDAVLADIDNSLKAMQEIVGGYIECYSLSLTETVVCNEEGRIRDLPYNCYIEGEHFYGTIFICGTAEEEFTDTNIDKELVKKIIR